MRTKASTAHGVGRRSILLRLQGHFICLNVFYLKKKKIKDLHGTTSSQHNLCFRYTNNNTITTNKSSRWRGETYDFKFKSGGRGTSNNVKKIYKKKNFQSNCQHNCLRLAFQILPSNQCKQVVLRNEVSQYKVYRWGNLQQHRSCYSVNPCPSHPPNWVFLKFFMLLQWLLK